MTTSQVDNRCSLPFTDLTNISLDTGMITPCCKIPVTPLDPVLGVFNKTVIEVRQSIIANERSPHCKSCWDIIDNGGISRRTQYSTHMDINWDTVDVMAPVEHIQVKFSKTCQLQCVYCGPWSSTTWQNNIADYKNIKFGISGNEPKVKKVLTEILDPSKLKTIQVSGGEPMLDEECIAFLKELSFVPDRKMSIITNLSYGRAVLNKLLEIISIHPTIKIYASLDAIGENSSRKYLNWDLWKSNFDILIENLQERILNYPASLINIKSTINTLTYEKTQEIVDFIIKYKRKGYKGLTFRFGTPFRNEATSMWSAPLNKDYKIILSTEDDALLNVAERQQIKLFNDMIDSATVIPDLAEKTANLLAVYK